MSFIQVARVVAGALVMEITAEALAKLRAGLEVRDRKSTVIEGLITAPYHSSGIVEVEIFHAQLAGIERLPKLGTQKGTP